MEHLKTKVKVDAYKQVVDQLCEDLRKGQLAGISQESRMVGSVACAKAVAEKVKLLVKIGKYSDANSLIEKVKELGATLQAARPEQVAISNLILRVLHLIRTEQAEDTASVEKEVPSQTYGAPAPSIRATFSRVMSLSNIMEGPITSEPLPTVKERRTSIEVDTESTDAAESSQARRKRLVPWAGKDGILEAMEELFAELDGVESQIASHAVEHILSKEVILTFGYSHTILQILKEAKKKRPREEKNPFSVIVCTACPQYSGHKMALALDAAGIDTTLIPDSNAWTVMDRVDKVMVSTHALLADGSILGAVGIRQVAEAARAKKVPFLAFGGLHKLTPSVPNLTSGASWQCAVPRSHHNAKQVENENLTRDMQINFAASSYDYVPADCVSVLITDIGGITPAHVKSFVTEYYCREDIADIADKY